jgi:CheY-like chemotaxis protein
MNAALRLGGNGGQCSDATRDWPALKRGVAARKISLYLWRMAGPMILVIEDNPLNVELVTDILEANGFSVRSAETAERGLELARQLSPGLILMDVHLPGMNGLNATKILKSDPATRHLKVVGLTAEAISDDEGAEAAAGFDGYLAKPIDVRTFAASVRAFIPKQSLP